MWRSCQTIEERLLRHATVAAMFGGQGADEGRVKFVARLASRNLKISLCDARRPKLGEDQASFGHVKEFDHSYELKMV